MHLLDVLTVSQGNQERRIELYHGDLTDLKPEEAVDILVVSAFQGNYVPSRGTLIGALDRKGISVERLARDKEVDVRPTSSCWLSKRLTHRPLGIQFRRILCFEPPLQTSPHEVVGDIFGSLVPIISADAANTDVAMPLVATGNMGTSPTDMLEALLDAATKWMKAGLPLRSLKIVEYDAAKASHLASTFTRWKQTHQPTVPAFHQYTYDVFISYSHANDKEVNIIVDELKTQRKGLRIFVDKGSLKPGMAWPLELYKALDACKKTIAVYTGLPGFANVLERIWHRPDAQHR